MTKDILTSFLIVILLNFFTGCSGSKSKKIPAANLAEEDKIIEAVLLDLKVVEFDDNGGRLEYFPGFVTGSLIDGKPFKMSTAAISEIRLSSIKPVNLADLNDRRIMEIHLKDKQIILTDSNGAVYNLEKSTITGNSNTNDFFRIKTDKVSKIFTDRPDILNLTDETNIEDIIVREILTSESNKVYTFDDKGGRISRSIKVITGFNPANKSIEINPDSVLYVNVKRNDPMGVILTIIGITALAVGVLFLVALASKQSCPFIYSHDGENYVFDAEPLGGATCKGFERTEYSRLDYLKNINGTCRILLRNDVDETQYIDELTLLAVKHDAGNDVVPDLDGKFYQVRDPVTPVSAEDENGTDLKEAVSTPDNLHWQTHMPVDTTLFSSGLRHELIFKFIKPSDKSEVKLIANIGTTLWGSQMIREMLQLYGNYVDTYYQKINQKGIEYDQVMNFIETEELYKLKYYTKNGDEWKYQGFINGGGPFVTETRVYNLDLSGIPGDTIVIKINPPYGFWSVDYLALEFENYPAPVVQTFFPNDVYDHNGTDCREIISLMDNNYYVMPVVGDFLKISFTEIPEQTGSISYYSRTSGYYEVHTDKNEPFRLDVLSRFITEPGYIVKYSNQKYGESKETGVVKK